MMVPGGSEGAQAVSGSRHAVVDEVESQPGPMVAMPPNRAEASSIDSTSSTTARCSWS